MNPPGIPQNDPNRSIRLQEYHEFQERVRRVMIILNNVRIQQNEREYIFQRICDWIVLRDGNGRPIDIVDVFINRPQFEILGRYLDISNERQQDFDATYGPIRQYVTERSDRENEEVLNTFFQLTGGRGGDELTEDERLQILSDIEHSKQSNEIHLHFLTTWASALQIDCNARDEAFRNLVRDMLTVDNNGHFRNILRNVTHRLGQQR